MKGIAQGHQQHLLVKAAQIIRRFRLERSSHGLIQALLVFADPVQQMAVAPQCWRGS